MYIALVVEHPTWSQELHSRLTERGHRVLDIRVGDYSWAASERPPAIDVWVNRINTMPSRPESAVAAMASARNLLAWLQMHGCRVMNGLLAYQLGASKAAQAALFQRVGANAPPTVAVQCAADAASGAERLGFPVVFKPNAGGSGRGVERYESRAALDAGIEAGQLDFGPDGTAVVQKAVDSADGCIYRIEVLDSQILYSTRQPLVDGVFNYCAIDGCATEAEEPALELTAADPGAAAHAIRATGLAGADLASAEYLLDADTGAPVFIDFNPYSNLIEGFDDELGFSPLDRLADTIENRAAS